MAQRFNPLFPVLPIILLTAACGNGSLKQIAPSDADLASLSMSDESEEAVADHVSDVAQELDLEESQSLSDISLGLVAKSESSLEKSCLVSGNTLTFKKNHSADRDRQRATQRGRMERIIEVDSSFERVYSAAEGHTLPLQCKSERGPIKTIEDKLAEFASLSLLAKSSRSHSIVLKKDGEVIQSRKNETSGTRTVSFVSASAASGQIVINKSLAIDSKSQFSSLNKGLASTGSNIYQTLKNAPLAVETARQAGSDKLISKTIKSGQVQILRGSGERIDIAYDMVKFSEACKPVSGRLEVTKALSPGGEPRKLSIEFKDGEAFVSKNGGAQEKMDSLNFRLESCRAK